VKLRTRLALALLVCGLVPLLGAGSLARVALARRYAQIEAPRREAALARVERTLDERGKRTARMLSRFCAHDYLIDRTLLQLETGQFTDTAQAELAAVLPEVGRAMGLDTFALVRADGLVLASAHYPGQAGSRDPGVYDRAARAREGGAWVRAVRVRETAGPIDRLVLESGCTRRRGSASVAVSGGEVIDDALLREIAGDDALIVQLVMGDAAGLAGGARRVRPLRGFEGAPVAAVVLEARDDTLRGLMVDIDRLTALSALLAALVAGLLAVLLAPRLAGPIGVVADAADRIAAGERNVQITLTADGEVGRLVAAFNRMTRELKEADTRIRRAVRMAAWRDIARQMAHEIKNPLTPIRMAVEMLRKARERSLPDFDELFEEETRIVLAEVERLRRLVEDFSRFARAPKPRPEPLSLPEVVAHATELHAGGAVPVTYSVEGGAQGFPLLRADRDQLTQVLVNLIANAVHAAAERAEKDPSRGPGAVTVGVARAGDGFARVTVEDNGGGIPAEVMERLFEPYVTTKQGGTGLGLAVTYRIVTDHGGTLTADTSAAGTRFTAGLPFAGPSSLDTATSPETG
jgi:two-component system nitrogen regulation sensor histidine kinase NtrY